MGRTIRFTNGANSFVQGNDINNTEVTLFMLGGNDSVLLNRDDDFGGRNRVDAGGGADTVRALDEDGSLILLGGGADVYIGQGFGSFATERADTVRGGGRGRYDHRDHVQKHLYRRWRARHVLFLRAGQQLSRRGGHRHHEL